MSFSLGRIVMQIRKAVLSLKLTLKPQLHYTNSPYWSPYTLFGTSWENVFKHQDDFGNQFLDSCDLFMLKCTDM